MNYNWLFAGTLVTLFGILFYLIYLIPYTWFVSVIGLIMTYVGFIKAPGGPR